MAFLSLDFHFTIFQLSTFNFHLFKQTISTQYIAIDKEIALFFIQKIDFV
ncbi:hypothetical protein L289_2810 [Acinetobacter gerneri DSM 14967 = CIP 107464 = MTCC 9824]|nr:hypothetical protein L289_2810 [Acinetobacter gerneri DSM 14967 = CIP 107464 = MTCC 9824]